MQVKCSDGRSVISEAIIKDTLPRRLFRIGASRGQRNQKWELLSSSRRQLHMGVMQLKLWENLWERRSENSTRNLVRSLIPGMSFIPKEERLGSRMDSNNLSINWINLGKDFISTRCNKEKSYFYIFLSLSIFIFLKFLRWSRLYFTSEGGGK